MSVFTEFAQGRSKLQRQIDELRQKSSDADSELRRAQEQRREVSKRPLVRLEVARIARLTNCSGNRNN